MKLGTDYLFAELGRIAEEENPAKDFKKLVLIVRELARWIDYPPLKKLADIGIQPTSATLPDNHVFPSDPSA